jgi:N-sulfoglucosamine sulfohydrolase
MYIKLILLLLIVIPTFLIKAQDSSLLQNNKPNVVLIVSHGHGTNDLGCYGNKIIKTPNLDKLAADGIKFINAHATVSSGSASQSVILTGLYNHANGQYGQNDGNSHFSIFPEIKSLPRYLKEAGYRTARTGLFLLDNKAIFFDTILGAGNNYRNTFEMAEQCNSFISQTSARPFFLYFCPADPSRSGEVNEDEPSKTNNFGNRDYEGIIPTYYKPNKIEVPSYLPDLPECRKELAQYAQAVSRMDLGIGRLLELLKKAGYWKNTLIIYISDAGIAFPGAQNTLYEAGIKLPCIIKPPFEEYRNICDAMINWADLTPTILDICAALPPEHNFHGRSFKDAMTQELSAGWDELYASHTFHEITMYYPMRMVMNRRYKLIRNIAWQLPFPIANDLSNSPTWQGVLKSDNELLGKQTVKNILERPEYELYDVINDPDEIKNLASNPEYASILADLKTRLKSFQVRTNDPWIIF